MRRYSKKQSELSILASHQKRFEKRWNWIFVVRDATPKSKVNSQSTHRIKKNDLKKDGMGFLYCETFLQKSKVNWQSSHRIKNSFWKKMEWDFVVWDVTPKSKVNSQSSHVSLWFFTVVKMVVRVIAIKWCFRVGNMNLLLEKCRYFAKMVYWDLRLLWTSRLWSFFNCTTSG